MIDPRDMVKIQEIDDSFKKHVRVSKTKAGYLANCKKGLFSVSGKNKPKVLSEARWYFLQYLADGEYGKPDNSTGE